MTESEIQSPPAVHSIAVDIYDQTYHLRGSNPEYIQKLATMVDSKMRAVASRSNTVDSLRVAVLAAVNLADELARLEQRYLAVSSEARETAKLRSRADNLASLLDSVLTESRRAG